MTDTETMTLPDADLLEEYHKFITPVSWIVVDRETEEEWEVMATSGPRAKSVVIDRDRSLDEYKKISLMKKYSAHLKFPKPAGRKPDA